MAHGTRRLALVVVLLGAAALMARPDPRQTDPIAPATPAPPGARPGPVAPDGDGIDLAEVRAALPDNLYWIHSAPTDDPAVLARRRADAAERNRRFGAIQAGLATDVEIHDYYDERRRISADAVAFAEHVLLRYGDRLPERDRGLLELAREMNEKRLGQLPDELARAEERKRHQDEARAAWAAATQGGP